jgi:hypothetical protein
MRLQVVREKHRLRMLEVRAPGHDRLRMRFGLSDERVHDAEDIARDRAGMIKKIHPDESCDLVVAAAARAQLAPELGADGSDQCLFESSVDVLVLRRRAQRAVLDTASERVEAVVHRPLLVDGEIPGRGQSLCMRVRPGDVVEREIPIEMRRAAERGQLR